MHRKAKKSTKGFNNTIVQLQKICNHPYLFKDEWDIDENVLRSSGKFDLLDRILPKLRFAKHRILIFSQMTQLMTIMEDYFSIRGYEYLRLDGSTKSEDRAHLVQLWNSPSSPYWLFMLSTKAGGLGLNLQTADTVIIFDTDWNPQADLQAQDRAHRIGQQNEVRVFRLVTHNSIEEKILERANFKLDVDAKVIQAGMFNTFANDKMRRAMLESLLHDQSDEKEVELVTSDEEINSLIARNDQEYQLFQNLDVERKKEELKRWHSQGNSGPCPPRLITENELPSYLKVNLDEEDEFSSENYGRGRRERPEVRYSDYTEAEFNKILDGKDVVKKRRRISEIATEDSSSSQGNPPKRRRLKQKPEEVVEEDTESKNLSRSQLQIQLRALWKHAVETTDEQGRLLSRSFMKLPSKRDYPDYYRVVGRPLSLNRIEKQLLSYRSPMEFLSDLRTMFSNAKSYNREGSQIYSDADSLQKIIEEEFSKQFPLENEETPRRISLHIKLNTSGGKKSNYEESNENQTSITDKNSSHGETTDNSNGSQDNDASSNGRKEVTKRNYAFDEDSRMSDAFRRTDNSLSKRHRIIRDDSMDSFTENYLENSENESSNDVVEEEDNEKSNHTGKEDSDRKRKAESRNAAADKPEISRMKSLPSSDSSEENSDDNTDDDGNIDNDNEKDKYNENIDKGQKSDNVEEEEEEEDDDDDDDDDESMKRK